MGQSVRSFGLVGTVHVSICSSSTSHTTIALATCQAWLQAINTPSPKLGLESGSCRQRKALAEECKVLWPHGLMVGIQVVLSEVIGFVGGTQMPEDVILALANAILNPVEMHVNGLGVLLLDVVIGNTSGSGVVCLNRGGGLGMAKF